MTPYDPRTQQPETVADARDSFLYLINNDAAFAITGDERDRLALAFDFGAVAILGLLRQGVESPYDDDGIGQQYRLLVVQSIDLRQRLQESLTAMRPIAAPKLWTPS